MGCCGSRAVRKSEKIQDSSLNPEVDMFEAKTADSKHQRSGSQGQSLFFTPRPKEFPKCPETLSPLHDYQETEHFKPTCQFCNSSIAPHECPYIPTTCIKCGSQIAKYLLPTHVCESIEGTIHLVHCSNLLFYAMDYTDCLIFDIYSKQKREYHLPMRLPINHAISRMGDHVYLSGGELTKKNVLMKQKSLYNIDLSTGKVERRKNMIMNRCRHAMSTIGFGALLSLGGLDEENKWNSSCELYESVTNSWKKAPSLIFELVNIGSFLFNWTDLYAYGIKANDGYKISRFKTDSMVWESLYFYENDNILLSHDHFQTYGIWGSTKEFLLFYEECESFSYHLEQNKVLRKDKVPLSGGAYSFMFFPKSQYWFGFSKNEKKYLYLYFPKKQRWKLHYLGLTNARTFH